jgi:hypothetical protein
MIAQFPRDVYKYLVIWAIILGYIFYLQVYMSSINDRLVYSLIFTTEIAFIYYLMFYLLLTNFINKKYLVLVFFYLLMFGVLWILDILLFKGLFPFLNITTQRDSMDGLQFLTRTFFWFLIISVFVYGNLVLKASILNMQLLKQRSFDSLNLELNSLRQQFHSHLTFNFLNQCYLELSEVSHTASESIENYIAMLDYSLIYYNKSSIRLRDEIEYISNFLSLQKKLSTNICYQFEANAAKEESVEVIPMIFAVPIEVLFRLCKVNELENPLNIKINYIDNKIFFQLIGLKESRSTLVLQDTLMVHTIETIKSYYNETKIVIDENETMIDLQIIIPCI